MSRGRTTTDYLVIGSGAMGMAFTDALVANSDARVVLVDRRHAPGGHWNDAYDFCRLHQPSAFYGVDSLPLGSDTVDTRGLNAGGYERATAPEIRGYYQRVLDERLLPSGRVEYLPMSEHAGGGRIVSRITGDDVEVSVGRALVDAAPFPFEIPATTPPSFTVAPDARWAPVGALPRLQEPAERYVIIGAGKTAMDAIIWLLEQGTDPDAITWIKSREAWLTNREFFQPRERAWTFIENASRYAEAGALASSVEEFLRHLHEHRILLRVDEDATPTMAKLPTINDAELAELRRVRHVVRMGHVRAISRNEIVLDGGTVPTSPGSLHVHCAASGTPRYPTRPVFAEGGITLQILRWNMPCLSAAVTGFVEARGGDLDQKNRPCRPHSLPDEPAHVPEMALHSMRSDYRWSKDPEVEAYVDGTRLNPARGWREQLGEPAAQLALQRFVEHAATAVGNLERLTATAED
jgi:hypothetical protein